MHHAGPSFGLFEQPDEGETGEAEQGHVAEVIDIRPQACLRIKRAVENRVSAFRIRNELAKYGESVLEDRIRGRERVDELTAMQLFVAGDDGVHHRDADASSDVAEQVVETAGVADLFVGQL